MQNSQLGYIKDSETSAGRGEKWPTISFTETQVGKATPWPGGLRKRKNIIALFALYTLLERTETVCDPKMDLSKPLPE